MFKNMKKIINYEALEEFLKTLSYRKIQDGALTKGHSMNDIEFFYKTDKDKKKITYDQVINYGDPFLVDLIGNDLSVCILTKRKYKVKGRLVALRLDRVIINDCQEVFGSCLNGYWVIPDRFFLD